MRKTLWLSILLAGLLAAVTCIAAPADDNALIAKGEYLARAGDCVACHTNPGGALFAGGLAMPTPFGTLYSTNITPDRDTGIGSWSADDFYGALHTSPSPRRRPLSPTAAWMYPAMYPSAPTRRSRARIPTRSSHICVRCRRCISRTGRKTCNSPTTIGR